MIPQPDEISILLNQLRDGKETAFNKLYSYYFQPIYRKVLFMVKEEIITDELVQELFLKVWEKRETIRVGESFQGYLVTIAHNLVYDYFRKVAKDKRMITQLLLNATDYYLHSDKIFEDSERTKILMQAIDELSPQRKVVFISCKFEGKSYQQTSEDLGISVATVNTHMTHSFKKVKEYMIKNYRVSSVLIIISTACSYVYPNIK